ncbi:MAG: transposase, partial [Rikenellaceae bacterium]|nr:transposase [Rikenellaceae bacterium]
MKDNVIVGVDVSKRRLDFCLMREGKILSEHQTKNIPVAISALIEKMMAKYGGDFLFCAEFTGQYTYPLACACAATGCALWLENPTQIKLSSGMRRGKKDSADARMIAEYANRHADKVRLHNRSSEQLERLKQLSRERALYVTETAKLKGRLRDQGDCMPPDIFKEKSARLANIIAAIGAEIAAIDARMSEICRSSEQLARQMELLTSIPGVGKVVALAMIIETGAFTKFDNPRSFNCHAG